jgi:hypothetical protein
MLTEAVDALRTGQTGAAQEALEEVETIALDRSMPQSEGGTEIIDPLVADICKARKS